jgi:hypothetical protein
MRESDDVGADVARKINDRIIDAKAREMIRKVAPTIVAEPGPARSERRARQRKPRMRRRGVALSTDQTPWVTPKHPPQVYDITKSGRVRGRA